MNIVFGNTVETLQSRFMCLELDTFKDPQTKELHTAWCVVNNIPLDEMAIADHLRQAHQDLMRDYRGREWQRCRDAIHGLRGRWNGEVDSFYDILLARINDISDQPLEPDWDGSILGKVADTQ